MLKAFLESRMTDPSLTEEQKATIFDLIREIQTDAGLLEAFNQEAQSKSKEMETMALSIFGDGDTWAGLSIDEIEAKESTVGTVTSSSTPYVDHSYSQSPSDAERYQDLGLLGKGGMGEVRRVHDTVLHRDIAIKIMHPEMARMHRTLQRFKEEAQVGAQLQHPNIVPVHDFGQLPDGRYFFTMKEIRGQEYSHLIQEVHRFAAPDGWVETNSGMTFRQLIQIFHTVCETMAYSHSLNVIHRDLKPENIMVGDYGEVLVVDWGIAKVLNGEATEEVTEQVVHTERELSGTNQTRYGMVSGTPAYMSPEQAMGYVDMIDERSDVYALGAILYEVLSGMPPYVGDSAIDILSQVQESINTISSEVPMELPEAKLHLDDKIPPLLIGICERAMSRDCTERFQSVEELSKEVLSWLEGAQRRDKALVAYQSCLDFHNQYKETLVKADLLWLEIDKRVEKQVLSDKKWWVDWLGYHQMQKEARGYFQEFSKLLKSSLVYDSTIPEANSLSANLLINQIVEASVLGDIQQVDALESVFQSHLQHVESQEKAGMLNRLKSDKTNKVNVLRAQRGELIGRKQILRTMKGALRDSSLVTLVGTAGTGKSRIAIEVLHLEKKNFELCYFCDLSTSTTELEVVLAVAQAMGVELRGADPKEQMAQVFVESETLLVLDNLEQVIAPCANVLKDWIAKAPNLRIIVTSRVRLKMFSEKVVPVSTLSTLEAMQLFARRGHEVNSQFELSEDNRILIGEIVQFLDKLPLAIELAAARLNVLSLEEIAERLNERFSILQSRSKSTPALQTALDWSWGLLSDELKSVLVQTTVFKGGFDIISAGAIIEFNSQSSLEIFDALEDLFETSLLIKQRGKGGRIRFGMLQSISEYAAMKMDEVQCNPHNLQIRHAKYYGKMGSRVRLDALDCNPQQFNHFREDLQNFIFGIDSINVQSAMGCCFAALKILQIQGPLSLGINLIEKVNPITDLSSTNERRLRTQHIIFQRKSGESANLDAFRTSVLSLHETQSHDSSLETRVSMRLKGEELLELGNIAKLQANYPLANDSYIQSLQWFTKIEHHHGVAQVHLKLGDLHIHKGDYAISRQEYEAALSKATDHNLYLSCIDAHLGLGKVLHRLGRYPEAIKELHIALTSVREIGDKFRENQVLGSMGRTYQDQGDYSKSQEMFGMVVEQSKRVGDKQSMGLYTGMSGQAYSVQGDYEKALPLFHQSLTILEEVGDLFHIASIKNALGAAHKDLNQYDLSIQNIQEAADISLEIGDKPGAVRTIGNLANIYQNLGQFDKAIEQYHASLEISQAIGDIRGTGVNLGNLGNVYQNIGDMDNAIRYFRQATDIAQDIGDLQVEGINVGNLGVILSGQCKYDEAIQCLDRAIEISREIGDKRNEGIYLGNLGDVYLKMEDWVKASPNLTQGVELCRDTFPVGAGAFLGSLGWVQAQLGDFTEAQFNFLEGELLVKVFPWEHVKFLCKKSKALSLNQDATNAKKALEEAIEVAESLNVSKDTEVWEAIASAQLMLPVL